MTTHPAAADLLLQAANAGWSALIRQTKDTGGNPYVTVEGRRPDGSLAGFTVTWHTRKTGTYRLFTCLHRGDTGGWRDASLKAVKAAIEETPRPQR